MSDPIELGNPASTTVPVHQLVRERWSSRTFDARVPSTEALRVIFEAARWAPSSYNEQPWSFVLATRAEAPADFERLLDCLVPANRAWAEAAPVLVLTVAAGLFERNEKANRHAWHDVGQSVAQMVLQAADLGLVAHQMAGFDAESARRELALPDHQEPVAVVAIGYPPPLDTSIEHPARARKPLEEIVFGGRWGRSHPMVE